MPRISMGYNDDVITYSGLFSGQSIQEDTSDCKV